MTAFTIEVKDSGIQAALDALAAKVGNMQPILQTIGEDIKARSENRFKINTGPDGQRWLPNARSTMEAYIRKQDGFGKKGINQKGQTQASGKRPLIGLVKSLMSQFHAHADGHSVTVSNSMQYAAIQQFGVQAGSGKKVKIEMETETPNREGLGVKFCWWPSAESNHGHADFQSAALPTELLGQRVAQYTQSIARRQKTWEWVSPAARPRRLRSVGR